MSFLKTSWALLTTKAGRFDRRSFMRTLVVGSLRMLRIYSGNYFF